MTTGPLEGMKILEFSGIGPGPFAAMLLAGHGATVLRLHRPGDPGPVQLAGSGVDRSGRPALAVDLKNPDDRALVLDLAAGADAVLEGFRPGVMERLGLGPEVLMARNRALVYARVTGYGQNGPLSHAAGHDINYLAVSGVLSTLARDGERPFPPLNLLGDYGGGGMLAAFGLLAGLLSARESGTGRIVDAAMVDGVAQLATVVFGFAAAGSWERPGSNMLDSGAPFYDVYETADGGHMAVGAIEPQFYAELLDVLGIAASSAPQWDRTRWPELKRAFAAAFRTRTRDDWTERCAARETCATPVLDIAEALRHPHNEAHGTFSRPDGLPLPAVAPRYSTLGPAPEPGGAPELGESPGQAPEAGLRSALEAFGIDPAAAGRLSGAPVARAG